MGHTNWFLPAGRGRRRRRRRHPRRSVCLLLGLAAASALHSLQRIRRIARARPALLRAGRTVGYVDDRWDTA